MPLALLESATSAKVRLDAVATGQHRASGVGVGGLGWFRVVRVTIRMISWGLGHKGLVGVCSCRGVVAFGVVGFAWQTIAPGGSYPTTPMCRNTWALNPKLQIPE